MIRNREKEEEEIIITDSLLLKTASILSGEILLSLTMDTFIEIISRNVNLFLSLSLTNKTLQQTLNSLPDFYFDLYSMVFRDECMILDLVSDDNLIEIIKDLNNYDIDIGNDFHLFDPYVMGLKKLRLVEFYDTDSHINEYKNNKMKQDIVYSSYYDIKNKLMKPLKMLLRDYNIDNQNLYNITKEVYELLHKNEDQHYIDFIYDARIKLKLPHAEICTYQHVLIIKYFFKCVQLHTLLTEVDVHFYGSYTILKYIFSSIVVNDDEYESISIMNLSILERKLFELINEIAKGLIRVIPEHDISLEERTEITNYAKKYIQKLEIDGIKSENEINTILEEEKRYFSGFIKFYPNIDFITELVKLHNEVLYNIKYLKSEGLLNIQYYKLIDYNRLKERICRIAFSDTKKGANVYHGITEEEVINISEYNIFWKELLIKTNLEYQEDSGRRSSHYLMQSKICLNCCFNNHDNLKYYDPSLFTYFCNDQCQKKVYNQLKSYGWNVIF